jgi:uncharacterized membrane protein
MKPSESSTDLERPRASPGTEKTGVTGSLAIPSWLWYSLAAMFLFGVWGVQAKLVMQHLSPMANQVLATPGVVLISLALLLRRGRAPTASGRLRSMGIFYAALTGLLGAAGNIAFYGALGQGSQASVVVPLTTLYPMVTVILAMPLLKERVNGHQKIGIALAVLALAVLGG